MNNLQQVETILQDIMGDDTVPRNIREKISRAIKLIEQGSEDYDFLRDSLTEVLDSVVQDPNLPLYTRTQIWNTVLLLESVQN
jgi:uncharacterized protein (UPF0147 family)